MYPDKLRVGSRIYRVRFVSSIRRNKNNLGICDEHRGEILIRKDLSEDEKLKTLVHELLHAMEFEYQIKMPHDAVYQYEEAIFDFLCANSDALYSSK